MSAMSALAVLPKLDVREYLKERARQIALALAEADAAVDYLNKSLGQEAAPAYSDIERLYEPDGVELPDVALRRFEDVEAFQSSVTANRRQYLEEQIRASGTSVRLGP